MKKLFIIVLSTLAVAAGACGQSTNSTGTNTADSNTASSASSVSKSTNDTKANSSTTVNTTTNPPNTNTDTTQTGTEENTDPDCPYEFLTIKECQDANGQFFGIVDSNTRKCIDNKPKYCCQTDVYSEDETCLHECTTDLECFNRRKFLNEVNSVQGYKCPLWSYGTCCTSPALNVEPIEPTEPFVSTSCPQDIENALNAAEGQDKLPAEICMEMYENNKKIDEYWTCSDEDYERIVKDLALINETFVAMPKSVVEQQYPGAIPFKLICAAGIEDKSTCAPFPLDTFNDAIIDCFGATGTTCNIENEQEGTCDGIMFVNWNTAINTRRLVNHFTQQASSAIPGSICEVDKIAGLSKPYAGYHSQNLGNGNWKWKMRSVDYCDIVDQKLVCHCDVRFEVLINSAGKMIYVKNANEKKIHTDSLCTDDAFRDEPLLPTEF